MKYIKNFKIFENLESKIDIKELEDILIDFKQMGLDDDKIDIKVGSSVVIDWNLFNNDKTVLVGNKAHQIGAPKYLQSSQIVKYTQGPITNNSLTIEFNTPEKQEYNISEVSEAYEMLKSYLYDNYDLIPNYIYINFHWDYLYFENFEKLKEYKNDYPSGHNGIILGSKGKYFKAHKLIFGFYEDPDAPFRGPEF
jgi:hypothetical protein